MKKLPQALILTSVFMLANVAFGDADAVIAKARQQLGGAEKLDAIETLVYKGELTGEDGQAAGSIVIYFKKPFKQRLVLKNEAVTSTTGFDDIEGWNLQVNNKNPSQWRIEIMKSKDLRRLRANTFENLYFFSNLDKVRGKIEDKGVVDFQGKKAHLIVFQYPHGVSYKRYFEPGTGDLIATVNDDGAVTKEEGELVVDGIRFPEKVTTYDADGNVKNTVVFKEVLVNTPLDDDLFSFPDEQLGNSKTPSFGTE